MEFKKGYYYFTEDMDRMIYVISVCHCEQCRARGFFEPFTVRYRMGELPIEDWVSVYEKDALISKISKITNDENDEDVQLFFENARTVALTKVNEMINQ